MTDGRDVVRGYSEDRYVYRHNSISAANQQPSKSFRNRGENYYSNRNCPEILSVFALQQRCSNDREKEIYYSFSSNDDHYFNMINYPIESSSRTPLPNSRLLNDISQTTIQETKFPQLTTRRMSNGTKKFPSLTSRSTSNINQKHPVPALRTSISRPAQTKIPVLSSEKRNKIQLSHISRRTD